jgi:hypothetical protein
MVDIIESKRKKHSWLSPIASQHSTTCNPTELLELQSPMTKIQSTALVSPFLNGVIQRPFSYEQHIMNQKLKCANFIFEKSCSLVYKVYCDMELNHNILVKQYCDDEMMCNKVHDDHSYHCKPSNTAKHSTFNYDIKRGCKTNIVFNGLQDLWCINHMTPDYYPDGSQDIFPIPIPSYIDSANKEGVQLLLSLFHCGNVTPRNTSKC